MKKIGPRTSCERVEKGEPTANYPQLRENCRRYKKIFLRTWKRTKIQTNTVLAEPRTSIVFVEKNRLETVRDELLANGLRTPYLIDTNTRAREPVPSQAYTQF